MITLHPHLTLQQNLMPVSFLDALRNHPTNSSCWTRRIFFAGQLHGVTNQRW
jgi:hypothetical protein